MKKLALLSLLSLPLGGQSTLLWIRGIPSGGVGSACIGNDYGFIVPTIGNVTCQYVGSSWIWSPALLTTIIYPGADSTTAIKVAKYDATTAVMTVDTTNSRVGFGITPLRQLHVYGLGQATAALTDAGNTGGTLYLQDSNGAGGNGGALLLGTINGFFTAIKAYNVNNGGNTLGDLAFSTRNLIGDTALTERMRLLANGNFGIGKSAPGTALDVTGTGTFSTSLISPILAPSADSTTAVRVTKADGATALVTVDSTNSRVGINTTPSSTGYFHVLGLSSANADTNGTIGAEGPTQAIYEYKVTGGNLGSIRYDGTTFTLRSNATDSLTTTNTLTKVPALGTNSNCTSSAAPAVCGSAAAGSVVVAAAGTVVQVNTTAVTANSQIFVMYDSSLGTKLSVTCNVTEPALYGVTARTGGSSFTITSTSPTANPACFSYFIVN